MVGLLNSFWGSAAGQAATPQIIGTHLQEFPDSGGTLNFSSLLDEFGVNYTPQENDVVLCWIARNAASDVTEAEVTPSGYELEASDLVGGCNVGFSWKAMGATPDTSLTVPNANSASNVGCATAIVHVVRGIDPVEPFPDGVLLESSTAPAYPNPSSISPSVANCLIYSAGATAGGPTALSRPSNLDSATNMYKTSAHSYSGTLYEISAGAGVKRDYTTGSVDIGEFTGDPDHGSGESIVAALRPYGPPIFGVTINDTIPLTYTITGSPVGSITSQSWRRNGVAVSTSETGPTPGSSDVGAEYTVRVTMANGPYSASVASSGLTYSQGNLLQQSGGDAILIQSGGDNIIIREFN